MTPEPLRGEDLRTALQAIRFRPVTEIEIRPGDVTDEPDRPVVRRRSTRPAFDRQAVGDDLAAGMTIEDAAAKHGISNTTAKVIRQERGITIRKPRAYDHAQALRDLEQGMTTRQVAEKCGVTVVAIRALRSRAQEAVG